MEHAAGGERAGKSRSAAMELVWRLRLGGLFWIVGPDYEQCRPEFSYVLDLLTAVGDVRRVSFPVEGSCRLVTRTGAEVVTKSAINPVKLAGEAPDGILLCEAAQCSPEVYLRLRGRVAEKRGWLWLSGTFEGSRGWYAEKFNDWQMDNLEGGRSFSLPSWSNTALYPGGQGDPEMLALQAIFPEDLFVERFGGKPCPPASLVFREFDLAAHVRPCRYEPAQRVEIAIDPGYAGAYAALAADTDTTFASTALVTAGARLAAYDRLSRPSPGADVTTYQLRRQEAAAEFARLARLHQPRPGRRILFEVPF